MFIDVIDMLKFPLASTGERFGVVRRFQPFIDGALESARLHAVTQPRLDFTPHTLTSHLVHFKLELILCEVQLHSMNPLQGSPYTALSNARIAEKTYITKII